MQITLDRVQANVGEQWFFGESSERIQTILTLFPETPARGYLLEQKLTSPYTDLDLNIYFDPPAKNPTISAGYGPNPFAIFDKHPIWQHLGTFWHLWASDSEFALITNCWLEFDTSQPLPPIPIPGIFFRLDSAEFQPWYTDRAFATLHGHALPLSARQTLQTCVKYLPKGACVSQLGLMLSRPGHPIRVYVRDIPPHAVGVYLHAVGFPGNIEEAQSLASLLAHKTSRLNLQLEILCMDGDGLSPRISLETKIDRKTGSWTPLLDYLVTEGLCSPENKTHLLNWPAKHTVKDPAYTVKKYINHIKITLAPDTPPQAKAYLGIFISLIHPRFI